MAEEVSAKQLRSVLELLTVGNSSCFSIYLHSLDFNLFFPRQFLGARSTKIESPIETRKSENLKLLIFWQTGVEKVAAFLCYRSCLQTFIVACTMPRIHPV